MFKTNFSWHNKIWGEQKKIEGTVEICVLLPPVISQSSNANCCLDRSGQFARAVAYAENFHGGFSKCQNFSLH